MKPKKYIFLVLCIFGVVKCNVPPTSDSLMLRKILEAVDVATSDEHLFDATLQLLKSLCVCMKEKLKIKEENLQISEHPNSVHTDEYSNNERRLEIYRKIYNNTCFDLRNELARRLQIQQDDTDVDFEDKTNTNHEKNILYHGPERNNSSHVSDNYFEKILNKIFIKTNKLHAYTIKRSNILRNPVMINKNITEQDMIIIISLQKIKNMNLNEINFEHMKDIITSKTSNKSIEIEIFNTKVYDDTIQANNNIKNATQCNLLSLYTYLVEKKKHNQINVLKLINKSKSIKIYVNFRANISKNSLLDICCGNNTQLCDEILKRSYSFSEENVESIQPHMIQSYKEIIAKIKNLLKLYDKKLKRQTKYPTNLNTTDAKCTETSEEACDKSNITLFSMLNVLNKKREPKSRIFDDHQTPVLNKLDDDFIIYKNKRKSFYTDPPRIRQRDLSSQSQLGDAMSNNVSQLDSIEENNVIPNEKNSKKYEKIKPNQSNNNNNEFELLLQKIYNYTKIEHWKKDSNVTEYPFHNKTISSIINTESNVIPTYSKISNTSNFTSKPNLEKTQVKNKSAMILNYSVMKNNANKNKKVHKDTDFTTNKITPIIIDFITRIAPSHDNIPEPQHELDIRSDKSIISNTVKTQSKFITKIDQFTKMHLYDDMVTEFPALTPLFLQNNFTVYYFKPIMATTHRISKGRDSKLSSLMNTISIQKTATDKILNFLLKPQMETIPVPTTAVPLIYINVFSSNISHLSQTAKEKTVPTLIQSTNIPFLLVNTSTMRVNQKIKSNTPKLTSIDGNYSTPAKSYRKRLQKNMKLASETSTIDPSKLNKTETWLLPDHKNGYSKLNFASLTHQPTYPKQNLEETAKQLNYSKFKTQLEPFTTSDRIYVKSSSMEKNMLPKKSTITFSNSTANITVIPLKYFYEPTQIETSPITIASVHSFNVSKKMKSKPDTQFKVSIQSQTVPFTIFSHIRKAKSKIYHPTSKVYEDIATVNINNQNTFQKILPEAYDGATEKIATKQDQKKTINNTRKTSPSYSIKNRFTSHINKATSIKSDYFLNATNSTVKQTTNLFKTLKSIKTLDDKNVTHSEQIFEQHATLNNLLLSALTRKKVEIESLNGSKKITLKPPVLHLSSDNDGKKQGTLKLIPKLSNPIQYVPKIAEHNSLTTEITTNILKLESLNSTQNTRIYSVPKIVTSTNSYQKVMQVYLDYETSTIKTTKAENLNALNINKTKNSLITHDIVTDFHELKVHKINLDSEKTKLQNEKTLGNNTKKDINDLSNIENTYPTTEKIPMLFTNTNIEHNTMTPKDLTSVRKIFAKTKTGINNSEIHNMAMIPEITINLLNRNANGSKSPLSYTTENVIKLPSANLVTKPLNFGVNDHLKIVIPLHVTMSGIPNLTTKFAKTVSDNDNINMSTSLVKKYSLPSTEKGITKSLLKAFTESTKINTTTSSIEKNNAAQPITMLHPLDNSSPVSLDQNLAKTSSVFGSGTLTYTHFNKMKLLMSKTKRLPENSVISATESHRGNVLKTSFSLATNLYNTTTAVLRNTSTTFSSMYDNNRVSYQNYKTLIYKSPNTIKSSSNHHTSTVFSSTAKYIEINDLKTNKITTAIKKPTMKMSTMYPSLHKISKVSENSKPAENIEIIPFPIKQYVKIFYTSTTKEPTTSKAMTNILNANSSLLPNFTTNVEQSNKFSSAAADLTTKKIIKDIRSTVKNNLNYVQENRRIKEPDLFLWTISDTNEKAKKLQHNEYILLNSTEIPLATTAWKLKEITNFIKPTQIYQRSTTNGNYKEKQTTLNFTQSKNVKQSDKFLSASVDLTTKKIKKNIRSTVKNNLNNVQENSRIKEPDLFLWTISDTNENSKKLQHKDMYILSNSTEKPLATTARELKEIANFIKLTHIYQRSTRTGNFKEKQTITQREKSTLANKESTITMPITHENDVQSTTHMTKELIIDPKTNFSIKNNSIFIPKERVILLNDSFTLKVSEKYVTPATSRTFLKSKLRHSNRTNVHNSSRELSRLTTRLTDKHKHFSKDLDSRQNHSTREPNRRINFTKSPFIFSTHRSKIFFNKTGINIMNIPLTSNKITETTTPDIKNTNTISIDLSNAISYFENSIKDKNKKAVANFDIASLEQRLNKNNTKKLIISPLIPTIEKPVTAKMDNKSSEHQLLTLKELNSNDTLQSTSIYKPTEMFHSFSIPYDVENKLNSSILQNIFVYSEANGKKSKPYLSTVEIKKSALIPDNKYLLTTETILTKHILDTKYLQNIENGTTTITKRAHYIPSATKSFANENGYLKMIEKSPNSNEIIAIETKPSTTGTTLYTTEANIAKQMMKTNTITKMPDYTDFTITLNIASSTNTFTVKEFLGLMSTNPNKNISDSTLSTKINTTSTTKPYVNEISSQSEFAFSKEKYHNILETKIASYIPSSTLAIFMNENKSIVENNVLNITKSDIKGKTIKSKSNIIKSTENPKVISIGKIKVNKLKILNKIKNHRASPAETSTTNVHISTISLDHTKIKTTPILLSSNDIQNISPLKTIVVSKNFSNSARFGNFNQTPSLMITTKSRKDVSILMSDEIIKNIPILNIASMKTVSARNMSSFSTSGTKNLVTQTAPFFTENIFSSTPKNTYLKNATSSKITNILSNAYYKSTTENFENSKKSVTIRSIWDSKTTGIETSLNTVLDLTRENDIETNDENINNITSPTPSTIKEKNTTNSDYQTTTRDDASYAIKNFNTGQNYFPTSKTTSRTDKKYDVQIELSQIILKVDLNSNKSSIKNDTLHFPVTFANEIRMNNNLPKVQPQINSNNTLTNENSTTLLKLIDDRSLYITSDFRQPTDQQTSFSTVSTNEIPVNLTDIIRSTTDLSTVNFLTSSKRITLKEKNNNQYKSIDKKVLSKTTSYITEIETNSSHVEKVNNVWPQILPTTTTKHKSLYVYPKVILEQKPSFLAEAQKSLENKLNISVTTTSRNDFTNLKNKYVPIPINKVQQITNTEVKLNDISTLKIRTKEFQNIKAIHKNGDMTVKNKMGAKYATIESSSPIYESYFWTRSKNQPAKAKKHLNKFKNIRSIILDVSRIAKKLNKNSRIMNYYVQMMNMKQKNQTSISSKDGKIKNHTDQRNMNKHHFTSLVRPVATHLVPITEKPNKLENDSQYYNSIKHKKDSFNNQYTTMVDIIQSKIKSRTSGMINDFYNKNTLPPNKEKTVKYNTYQPTYFDEFDASKSIEGLHEDKLRKILIKTTRKFTKITQLTQPTKITPPYHIIPTQLNDRFTQYVFSSSTTEKKIHEFIQPLKKKKVNLKDKMNMKDSQEFQRNTGLISKNYRIFKNSQYLVDDPFAKTQMYPVTPPKRQRKVMKTIDTYKKIISEFSPQQYFVSTQTRETKTKSHWTPKRMRNISPPPLKRAKIVSPGLESTKETMGPRTYFRAKPLMIENLRDEEFYRTDNEGLTDKEKDRFLEETIHLTKQKIDNVLEKPDLYNMNSYISPMMRQPKFLRDRVDSIRNFIATYPKVKQGDKDAKPEIWEDSLPQSREDSDEELMLEPSLFFSNRITRETTTARKKKRRGRTIFFLSPTVPYNRYFR